MAQPTFIGTIALPIIFSKTQNLRIANSALLYSINFYAHSVRQTARHLKVRAVFTSLRFRLSETENLRMIAYAEILTVL